MIRNFVKLLRVKHYLKNLLVFFPIVFAGHLFDLYALFRTVGGFFAFSFTASIIYILNDINDVEADRRHPKKCKRPLASGAVSLKQAKILVAIMIVAAFFLNYIISNQDWKIWGILLLYLCSNIVYSFGGKNIALLDVSILALGYVLRVYYGALIIQVSVSSWLYLTVLSMAFFLGFGKRRNELKFQGKDSRKVLREYPMEFLDKIMYLCLGLTITFYSLWCEAISQLRGNQLILFSVPFMILICVRYSMDVEGNSDGDPIEVVISDKVLVAICLCYGLLMMGILYGGELFS